MLSSLVQASDLDGDKLSKQSFPEYLMKFAEMVVTFCLQEHLNAVFIQAFELLQSRSSKKLRAVPKECAQPEDSSGASIQGAAAVPNVLSDTDTVSSQGKTGSATSLTGPAKFSTQPSLIAAYSQLPAASAGAVKPKTPVPSKQLEADDASKSQSSVDDLTSEKQFLAEAKTAFRSLLVQKLTKASAELVQIFRETVSKQGALFQDQVNKAIHEISRARYSKPSDDPTSMEFDMASKDIDTIARPRYLIERHASEKLADSLWNQFVEEWIAACHRQGSSIVADMITESKSLMQGMDYSSNEQKASATRCIDLCIKLNDEMTSILESLERQADKKLPLWSAMQPVTLPSIPSALGTYESLAAVRAPARDATAGRTSPAELKVYSLETHPNGPQIQLQVTGEEASWERYGMRTPRVPKPRSLTRVSSGNFRLSGVSDVSSATSAGEDCDEDQSSDSDFDDTDSDHSTVDSSQYTESDREGDVVTEVKAADPEATASDEDEAFVDAMEVKDLREEAGSEPTANGIGPNVAEVLYDGVTRSFTLKVPARVNEEWNAYRKRMHGSLFGTNLGKPIREQQATKRLLFPSIIPIWVRMYNTRARFSVY